MSQLRPTEYALLEVLAEDSGLTTKDISARLKINYCSDNARQRSGAVRAWLMEMKKRGLVDYLADLKPVCWKRTAAGSAAIQSSSPV